MKASSADRQDGRRHRNHVPGSAFSELPGDQKKKLTVRDRGSATWPNHFRSCELKKFEAFDSPGSGAIVSD